MKIYKCEKCGSTDVFIECNENHRGLYCGDCGKWIKWLNKDEERLALRQIINQQTKNKNEESIRADERARTIEEVTKLFNEMRPRLATNISEFADRLEQLKEQK